MEKATFYIIRNIDGIEWYLQTDIGNPVSNSLPASALKWSLDLPEKAHLKFPTVIAANAFAKKIGLSKYRVTS